MKRSAIQRKTTMPRTTRPVGILGQASHQAIAKAEPKKRMKKCVIAECRKPFEPHTMQHVACSIECALAHVDLNNARKAKKEKQAGLLKLKSRADWLKEAQTAMNAWVRQRDAAEPCISCGRHHKGQYHAGHYLSVGAHPELRFERLNVHKQCRPCNEMLAGNIVLYRAALIAKIGVAAVEWLEGPHEPAKYTIEQAQAIKAYYVAALKQLKNKGE